MTGQSTESQLGLILPNLALLFLMSWGIVSSDNSLRSPKEGGSNEVSDLAGSNRGQIDSYSWEDPLAEAVKDIPKEVKSWLDTIESWKECSLYLKHFKDERNQKVGPLKSLGKVYKSWHKDLESYIFDGDKVKGRADVLIVGYQGGFGALAVEGRIRQRTAIMQTLMGRYGYRRLGGMGLERCVARVPILGSKNKVKVEHKFIVPYEKFEVSTQPKRTLIVCYYEESRDSFNRAQLLEGFLYSMGASSLPEHNEIKKKKVAENTHVPQKELEKRERQKIITQNTHFNYIGFNDSDHVRKFLSTTRLVGKARPDTPLRHLTLYSPASTLDGEALKKAVLGLDTQAHDLEFRHGENSFTVLLGGLCNNPLTLYRMASDDTALAAAFWQEAKWRNLFNGDENPNILLVTEAESLYSKYLATTLKEANPDKKNKAIVEAAYYLKGLDGVALAESKKQKSDDITLRAEGTARYDYLVRLGDEIKRQERVNENGAYTAIGVMGSDPHDRLLVLQALRKRFRDRFIFTFGLDARLWTFGKFKAPQNVVTFSSYPLSMEKASNVEGEKMKIITPPFRSDIQVATAFAVQRALKMERPETYENTVKKVFIHEISRSGFKMLDSLNVESAGDLVKRSAVLQEEEHSRHSDVEQNLSQRHFYAFGVGLLSLAIFLCWRPWKEIRELKKLSKEGASHKSDVNNVTRIHVAGIIFILSGVVVIGFLFHRTLTPLPLGEEPVSFLTGISVWPSTFMLGLTALFCGYWIWYSAYRLRSNVIRLTLRYPFNECQKFILWHLTRRKDKLEFLNDDLFTRIQNFVKTTIKKITKERFFSKAELSELKKCPKNHLFCGYMSRYADAGRQRHRLCRVIVGVLLATLLFVIFLSQGADTSAESIVRGNFSRLAHESMNLICSTLLLILLIFIVDAQLYFWLTLRTVYRALSPERHRVNQALVGKEMGNIGKLTGPINPLEREDLSPVMADIKNGENFSDKDKKNLEKKIKDGVGFWESPVMVMAASRYRVLSSLIFLPFAGLFFFLTSKHSAFEGFVLSRTEIVFFIISFLALIGISLLMEQGIKRCFTKAAARISSAIWEHHDNNHIVAFLKNEESGLLSAQKQSSHTWLRSPLVRALLVPIGGTGILQAMELIAPFI